LWPGSLAVQGIATNFWYVWKAGLVNEGKIRLLEVDLSPLPIHKPTEWGSSNDSRNWMWCKWTHTDLISFLCKLSALWAHLSWSVMQQPPSSLSCLIWCCSFHETFHVVKCPMLNIASCMANQSSLILGFRPFLSPILAVN
jgi:hypothetical protein